MAPSTRQLLRRHHSYCFPNSLCHPTGVIFYFLVMPFLSRPCGAKIYYEIHGALSSQNVKTIPVLLLAPGGMRSSVPKWAALPYNPLKCLSSFVSTSQVSPTKNRLCLIAMDQRFANRSTGTLENSTTDLDYSGENSAVSWHTFLEDQLALLDHLKVEQCSILGSCIGPSYAFRLLQHSPSRFRRCVMLQPIGLAQHTTEPLKWDGWNTNATRLWFGDFAGEMVKTKNWDETLLKKLQKRMFENGRDFVFSVTKEEAARIETPILVFMGRDFSHPSQTSREIAKVVPNAELIEEWRDLGPDVLAKAASKIETFLREE